MEFNFKAILSSLKPYFYVTVIILIAMFFVWRTTRNNVKARYEQDILKIEQKYDKLIRELTNEQKKKQEEYQSKIDSLDEALESLEVKKDTIYLYYEKDFNSIIANGVSGDIEFFTKYLSKNDSIAGGFINPNN